VVRVELVAMQVKYAQEVNVLQIAKLVKFRATAGVRPLRMISTTVVRVESLAMQMKYVATGCVRPMRTTSATVVCAEMLAMQVKYV